LRVGVDPGATARADEAKVESRVKQRIAESKSAAPKGAEADEKQKKKDAVIALYKYHPSMFDG
jgi:hypothetical protein